MSNIFYIPNRFHATVKDSLEKKRADVIELYQPMTKLMNDIHGGIVQCMSTTLAELKRSNTTASSIRSPTLASVSIFQELIACLHSWTWMT